MSILNTVHSVLRLAVSSLLFVGFFVALEPIL